MTPTETITLVRRHCLAVVYWSDHSPFTSKVPGSKPNKVPVSKPSEVHLNVDPNPVLM